MFDMNKSRKIKNDKILRWTIQLSSYSYDIVYCPGHNNFVDDALLRSCCSMTINGPSLRELHESLCHPGITRMYHFIKSKNLPFSIDDVKKNISLCQVCAELKPKFYVSKFNLPLIKSTQPFERLSIDFKNLFRFHLATNIF
jgi:hypothetical protein